MRPIKFYLLTLRIGKDLISSDKPLPLCIISETGIQIILENNDPYDIPFHNIIRVRFSPYVWFTAYRMFVKLLVDDPEKGLLEFRLEPANPIFPNSKVNANFSEALRMFRVLRDLKDGKKVEVIANPYVRNRKAFRTDTDILESDYMLDPHSFYEKYIKKKQILGFAIPFVILVVVLIIGLVESLK